MSPARGTSFDSPPTTVIVEVTNVCTLRCPLCSTFLAMRRPRGFMEPTLFRRLVDEFAQWPHKPLIAMTMCGEPLLHRQVDELVACAAGRGLETFISTNVVGLDASLGRRLIEAGLSSIYLCVDGASAASHEAYRVGSRFEQVRQNCEGFLRIRAELARGRPRVTIQSLLTAYSEDETDAVVNWAAASGADEVFFKSLSLGTHGTPEQRAAGAALLPRREEYRRHPPPAAGACRYPAEHTIVYWNGDLGICCIDYNNAAGLPGVQGRSLRDALASDPVRQAREAGAARRHVMCAQCASQGGGFRGRRVDLRDLRSRGVGGVGLRPARLAAVPAAPTAGETPAGRAGETPTPRSSEARGGRGPNDAT